MNFEEARRELLEGKKVRCVDWARNTYIYFDDENLLVKDENRIIQSYGIVRWKKHEWELYEEDERSNIMNFEEAKKALLEGKKVRCKDWSINEYIYFDNENFLVIDEAGKIDSYGIGRWYHHEWEYYEEPKKVIKVFISQPMCGRNKCEITEERNKIKKAIEKKYGKGYQIEYLNENLWERPKDWTRIQNLGCSIMNMFDADIVVFAPKWIDASGCLVEHEVAYYYSKKMFSCIIDTDGEYRLY